MADTVRSWLNEFGDASLIPLRWRLLLDMSLSQTAAIHCVLLLWLLSQGVASYRSLFREKSSPKGYWPNFRLFALPAGHPSVVRPLVRRVNRPWLLSSSNMPLAGVLFRSDTSQSKIDWVKGPSDVQTRWILMHLTSPNASSFASSSSSLSSSSSISLTSLG